MTEAYIPTAEERVATLAPTELLRLSGDGMFATQQGEGMTAGEDAVFIRLHNCNLHCGGGGEGWRCDAWYTWDKTTPEFWQEATQVSVDEVAARATTMWDANFGENPHRRLVVTGGEPLLQQEKVASLVGKLPDWAVEIETNGTIAPRDELRACQINCSPKLATSGNERRARYRPRALQTIASFPNHWFKFVITGGSDIEEMSGIVEANGIDYSHVILMSEGTDPEALTESDKRLAVIAHSLGCFTTKRNQIFWFGDVRAT